MTGNIGSNDVLCGRAGYIFNHAGNKHFRAIVTKFQTEYLEARKEERAVIARRIVARVRENGGRFLKRDDATSKWVEVPVKFSVTKTDQKLREGLSVSHKTIRPEKMPRQHSETSEESPRKRAQLVTSSARIGSDPGQEVVQEEEATTVPGEIPSIGARIKLERLDKEDSNPSLMTSSARIIGSDPGQEVVQEEEEEEEEATTLCEIPSVWAASANSSAIASIVNPSSDKKILPEATAAIALALPIVNPPTVIRNDNETTSINPAASEKVDAAAAPPMKVEPPTAIPSPKQRKRGKCSTVYSAIYTNIMIAALIIFNC
jgi:hypothetical protein